MQTDIKIHNKKFQYAREVSIKKRLDNWLNKQAKAMKETKDKK